MGYMTREGELPSLPKGLVNPAIVTGIDALGRNQELSRLSTFYQISANAFGPQVVAQYLDIPKGLQNILTALGITDSSIIK
jgi:hypothetical protein